MSSNTKQCNFIRLVVLYAFEDFSINMGSTTILVNIYVIHREFQGLACIFISILDKYVDYA